ncbi:MAG: ATP-dependent RecD-like DNA helicase [Oscillospiraceae bacterium]|nr:ATP-dependent RecD-like DNA helicase [Oscillospiraceae bacterium]
MGNPTEKLSGRISAVVYENPENGYVVMRVKSGIREVTAVGIVPMAAPGEKVELTGNWTRHSAYGEQFHIDSALREMPSGAEDILEFLSSHTIPGIGEKTAALLVEAFGDETLDVLERSPEKLLQVKGITSRKAGEISSSFRRRTAMRRLIELLCDNGINASCAPYVYSIWGDEAVASLKEDPYMLLQEGLSTDFELVDAMAMRLGINPQSDVRIRGAVRYVMLRNLGNGHVFLPAEKLAGAVMSITECEAEDAMSAIWELESDGEVVSQTVSNVTAVYLSDYFYAEDFVANRLFEMASTPLSKTRRPFISPVVDDIEYSELQSEAIRSAAENRVMLLTGGPGTGKTTTVRGILAAFEIQNLRTALVAPTGKAANRLGSVCGREASTLHRLLEAGGGENGKMGFGRNADEPLDIDAIILDEMSMVDIKLMSALLEAMPPDCRLVMVGDPDQLSSVGAGRVLSDILRSGVVKTIRLTEIFRQAQQSLIVMNAHRVNSGKLPETGGKEDDYFFMTRDTDKRVAETVVELLSKRLPENMGIPREDIQVISPARKGEAGVIELNRALQAALNPPSKDKPELQVLDKTFRLGDRVMQIKNNYDITWKQGLHSGSGVFNGDTGRIVAIGTGGIAVTVEFDDKTAYYSEDMVIDMDLAYAMTVHKSQGSEFPAVVMVTNRVHPILMTRGVLYTGMTRAKNLLVAVGSGECIAAMTANDKQEKRYSGLYSRLKKLSAGDIAEQ